MATRSRLGRDPLAGPEQTAKDKPGEAALKAKAARPAASGKAKPKVPAPKSPAKGHAVPKPDIPAGQPVAETAPPAAPTIETPAEAASLDMPMPVAVASAVSQAANVRFEPAAPVPAPEEPWTSVAASPDEADASQGAAPEAVSAAPDMEATELSDGGEATAPAEQESTTTTSPPRPEAPRATADPLPTAAIHPAASANALAVGEAHTVIAATAPPPAEGPHPAEVFLRGVLEGLTPAGGLTLQVDVEPETYALPVEKLFYFSHALQLLIAPLESPTDAWRRPGDGRGPAARLTVKLAGIGNGRHRLRIYDNGLFFQTYLPDPELDREALRPLLLFVAKRAGSICLKRGRCVEFEIIG